MSPWELCKGGTEHGHQRALFAWCKIAEKYGFKAAWDTKTYEACGLEYIQATYPNEMPCWPLKWFHAVPNGGSLGDSKQSQMIRGAQKKAEGVKPGVYDTFLPWPSTVSGPPGAPLYHGLFLEMKKPGELKKRSVDQKTFGADMLKAGYACAVADNWLDAAHWIERYMTGGVIQCPAHNVI